MPSYLPGLDNFPSGIDEDRLAAGLLAVEQGRHSQQSVTEAILVSGVDATLGEDILCTLTANRVLGRPLNGVPGQRLQLVLTQGGAGSFALTAGTGVTFSNFALNPAVGAVTTASLVCLSPTSWVLALNPLFTLAGKPFYNALDPANGIKGDATDETTAWNTFLGTLPTTGAVIMCPPPPGGSYGMFGVVTVPTALKDLTIMGSGGATLFNLGSAGDLIASSTTRFRLADCRVSSTQSGGAGNNSSVFAQSATGIKLVNVRFENGVTHLNLNNCDNFLVLGCSHKGHTLQGSDELYYNCRYGNVIGPIVESYVQVASGGEQNCIRVAGGSHHIDIVGGTINGVDFSQITNGAGVAFTDTNTAFCTLTGMVVTGLINGDGVITEAGAADIDITGVNSSSNASASGAGSNANNGDGFDIFNSKRIRLVGCTGSLNGTVGSTKHQGLEVVACQDVTAEVCDFSGNGAWGVRAGNAVDLSLIGVISRRNVNAGLYADNTGGGASGECLNLRIIGGDFSDNNTGNSGSGVNSDGIHLANATEAVLIGVRATDTRALAAKTQLYGFATANTAFAMVSGCDFRGNKNGPINDPVSLSKYTDTQGVNPWGVITMSNPTSAVVTSFPIQADGMALIAGGTITDVSLGGSPIAAAPTLAAATTGGTLATNTYGYKVTTLTRAGETAASAEATVAVTGPTGKVTITVARVRGAIGYNVYGRTSGGAWGLMGLISVGLAFVDDGSVTPGAAAPGADTSGVTTSGITAQAAAGNVLSVPADWGGSIKITYSVAPTSIKLVLH